GASTYTISDNGGTLNSTINYTKGGLEVTIKRTAAATYEIKILRKEDGTVATFSRTFSNPSGGQVPAQVRFFNSNAGVGGDYDFFINHLSVSNPVITAQPSTSTQSVCKDASAAALSVTVSGSGLSYQWYSNASNSNTGGNLVDGATLSSYTPSTAVAGTLYYYCIVTGTCGSATSNPSGAITVTALPTITSGGTVTAVCYNVASQTTTLTYTATTQTPVSYSIDWDATANSAGLSDQTTTSFSFASGGGTLNTIAIPGNVTAGTYNGTMTITNASNCTGTLAVTVTVQALPTITTTGTVAAVCYNAVSQTGTLAYSATTGSPTSYSIDWATLTDQGSTSLAFSAGGGSITDITIPAGTAAGTYTGTLSITNANGCSNTQAISVT
ncbi:MAG: hypothetical protein ACOVP6_04270, partial [Lacibacter sp.]